VAVPFWRLQQLLLLLLPTAAGPVVPRSTVELLHSRLLAGLKHAPPSGATFIVAACIIPPGSALHFLSRHVAQRVTPVALCNHVLSIPAVPTLYTKHEPVQHRCGPKGSSLQSVAAGPSTQAAAQ
jgi:hypothetical protein